MTATLTITDTIAASTHNVPKKPIETIRNKASEALYVIKIGSATIDAGDSIFDELAELARAGRRVLLIAGGGNAIERQYRHEDQPIAFHTLSNGENVRAATMDDIAVLVRAYQDQLLPKLKDELSRRGIRLFAMPAYMQGLVQGTRNRPLKTVKDGRPVIVRDHLVGVPTRCEQGLLLQLLENFDIVCLTAPIECEDKPGSLINTDADMLAAFLAATLRAEHVKFVTSTPGILRDVSAVDSQLADIYPGDPLPFVQGRMKQKIRAANYSIEHGIADVCIVGPHSFARPAGITRVWPIASPNVALDALTQAVSINSVSTDEADFVQWLVMYCRRHGVDAKVDGAGNFVASKGDGKNTLLLLGHVDTVPFPWRPRLTVDGHLSARGIVDAKGSLINFVEALIKAQVPPHGRLIVVGAVEEEISSSKGAFHVRDTLTADAVVIGEPSRSDTLTLGYYGLLKLRITSTAAHGHSAGKGVVSAPDLLLNTVAILREKIMALDPEGINALIGLKSWSDAAHHYGEAILNFRVSPKADLPMLVAAVETCTHDNVQCEILRATPGYSTTRTCNLARSFLRAFSDANLSPRFVVKKGTSDMNTLATRWTGVDMVAYGPGDSALDHSDHEYLTVDEYRLARSVLDSVITHWFSSKSI